MSLEENESIEIQILRLMTETIYLDRRTNLIKDSSILRKYIECISNMLGLMGKGLRLGLVD